MSALTNITPVGAPMRRRRKRIQPHRVAMFIFLLMAAAFFCVPLYVILVTAFKTMDEIRLGEIFALPSRATFEAWSYAWSQACSGTACTGLAQGFWNSIWILIPSLILSIALSGVTGYAMALWNVRWANTL